MSNFSKRALFWTPRALLIVFIAFSSIFALDVFDGHHNFRQTLLTFIIHEIPVFVLIAALIVAWRWKWIGAVLCGVAGLLHISWAETVSRSVPPVVRLIWILIVPFRSLPSLGCFCRTG